MFPHGGTFIISLLESYSWSLYRAELDYVADISDVHSVAIWREYWLQNYSCLYLK
jgi:hypothetical protein